MKLYFAGPLFTPYERDFISKCAKVLRDHGFDPFVPHEDHLYPRPTAKVCFANDFGGISRANAMLAIIDGTEVDDGTACEIGIFHALMQTDPTKKGIVALHDDLRTNGLGEGKGINAFVLGCLEKSGKVVRNIEEAVAQLEAWNAELTAGSLGGGSLEK
ncbi:MAG: nucleoside 2-deoxyribosyltransferase [Chloroflexi bacterium]|nr:nucleoside 2-deoxyribosyltransferase [Chloroflexota bacterium]